MSAGYDAALGCPEVNLYKLIVVPVENEIV